MSAIAKQTWTVEQYLDMERASEEKHEFLDGEIYLISGASRNHNAIQVAGTATLYQQLRKRPCFVFGSDMRVKVNATGMYTYPDFSLGCGEAQIEDEHQDTLLNPTVIVEILSPSTERYDRGKKFQHYRSLELLREYVLIAQDSPRVERYTRQADNQWLLADAVGLDATLTLDSIGAALALADVYEKVSFESETPSQDTETPA